MNSRSIQLLVEKRVDFSHFSAIMKFKSSFVTASAILWLAVASGKDPSSVVPYAIENMIEKHFTSLSASHPGNIDIIWFGRKTKEFSKLVGKILKIKKETTKLRVHQIDKVRKAFTLTDSAITFFESVERFKIDAPLIKWVFNKRQRYHHLVYVPGLTTSDILGTFTDGFHIDHVNFLMHETDKSIELVAGFMFTPQACRTFQLKAINRFNFEAKMWENPIFYPKKYQNFHGCELDVATDFYDNQDFDLLSMIFEDNLNAKLNLENINHKNIIAYDLIAIAFGNVVLNPFDCDSCVISNPHKIEVYNFAVAPGEPYTDLERMFMMFSFELWIAIIATLGIAVFTTITLNFMSKKIRNFVVGRYIQNPTMNLFSVFLSGGQIKTPGRNFARFLLMLFIVWSLIIRTCHQSMLFELLQADLRRPPMKTLDEFFESNLTVYLSYNSYMLDEYFLERMKMPSTK